MCLCLWDSDLQIYRPNRSPKMGSTLTSPSGMRRAFIPIAWLCLKHRSSPVCNRSRENKFPIECSPCGWLMYMVTIDRQQQTSGFVPHLTSSDFSTVGFRSQKLWVLETAYNLQWGSAPFFFCTPFLLVIYTGFFFLQTACNWYQRK